MKLNIVQAVTLGTVACLLSVTTQAQDATWQMSDDNKGIVTEKKVPCHKYHGKLFIDPFSLSNYSLGKDKTTSTQFTDTHKPILQTSYRHDKFSFTVKVHDDNSATCVLNVGNKDLGYGKCGARPCKDENCNECM